MAIAAVRAAASPVLLLVCLAFGIFMLLLIRFVYALAARARPAPRWLARFGPARDALGFVGAADPALTRDTGLLVRATLCEVVIVLLDSATMWCLIRALGTHASPVGVFASFVLSFVVNSLGFALPGGLGLFEAVSIVTLRLTGVPVAVALSASLLYRGLSFWLPMLPGFWFSHRQLRDRALR
jgi:Mg2+-importing ATPase